MKYSLCCSVPVSWELKISSCLKRTPVALLCRYQSPCSSQAKIMEGQRSLVEMRMLLKTMAAVSGEKHWGWEGCNDGEGCRRGSGELRESCCELPEQCI